MEEDTIWDIIAGVSGSVLFAMQRLPGLGEGIAGIYAYKANQFKRQIKKMTDHLNAIDVEIKDLKQVFKSEWLQSEEGKTFCYKVLDCILDAQIEDKQQLFVNALINGITDDDLEYIQKLKFIDILRNIAYASLIVLAKMHDIYKDDVRIEGRQITGRPFPVIDRNDLAKKLGSDTLPPYLVISSIYEMESQGLFSNIGEWKKKSDGTFEPGGGFRDELTYTHFTSSFVEFITLRKEDKDNDVS